MKDFAKGPITIAIIGAGVMGRGIAQLAAVAGIKVILHDLNDEVVDDALGFVYKMIDRAVEKGRILKKIKEGWKRTRPLIVRHV